MSEWQPIETAPKDGTRMDVWATWRHEMRPSDGVLARRFADAYWFLGNDGSCGWMGIGLLYEPTHWMPLPTAPRPAQEG